MRGDNAKPKPHSPSLTFRTLARSLSVSVAFSTQHSIHHSGATVSLDHKGRWNASTSSLLSNHLTKNRSPCYRDALLSPPPFRFHTTLQPRTPTACDRTSPRFWFHWRLLFLPRLDGAGPAPRFFPTHLSLEPRANLCHDAATGNSLIDPAPPGLWPAPDLGPVDPDHPADTTWRIRWH